MSRIETIRRNKVLFSAACAGLGFAVSGKAASAALTVYSYTGATQTWTVPSTGTYDIVAYGGQGGTDGDGTLGGKGAEVGGFFSLIAGQSITIDVGGQGGTGGTDFGGYGGGGGGGTFIYNNTTSKLLLAAGGGGGAYMSGQLGGSGLITLGANPGQGVAGDGVNGGGGGGFLSGGGGQEDGGGFPSLSAGVAGYVEAAQGVFGGGGAGGGYGAGGGGGYSGGAPGVPGNGGYSFNGGTTPVAVAGFQSGNGVVDITSSSVPEPTAAVVIVAGFAAFASRRRVSM